MKLNKKAVAVLMAVALIPAGNSNTAMAANVPSAAKELTITEGSKKIITVKGSFIKSKSFKSTNKKIATVNSKGMVTAVSKGECKIKITIKYRKSKKANKILEKNFVTKVMVNPKQNATPEPATPVPSQEPDVTKVPENTVKPEITEADNYSWQDKQLPIFVGCYSDEQSEYLGTVFLENRDNWELNIYKFENSFETLKYNVDNGIDTDYLSFNAHLGLNTYFLGTYKMVLQWGDKFAPITKDGIGEWGTLSNSLNNTEVINDEYIPFNFNYPDSKTYEEYRKSIESSQFLIFDKDNNSMFKVSLANFGNAAIDHLDINDYIAEYENGKSTVSAKVIGKGSNGGFNVEVTWKFNKDDVYLKDLVISGLEHELVSGDNKVSSGTCVYEYTGIDYNAGSLTYTAVDSNDVAYYGDIMVSGIYDKNVAGEIILVTGEENKDKKIQPKVTVSGIPEKAVAGESFTITISTDIKATMSLNGMSEGGYRTSSEFTISSNGKYKYRAVSESGGITEGTIEITCFEAKGNSDSSVSNAFQRF